MANPLGYHSHGSQGGKYARNKNLSIDFSQFEEIGEKLDKLGADLRQTIGGAMEKAADKVQKDVDEAIEKPYLPAEGIYSQGDTEKSVIQSPKVEWSGETGEVKLGFDLSKPGAGGFLITGTPKMQPDKKLAAIFQSRKYKSDITKQIREDLQEEVNRRMKGK